MVVKVFGPTNAACPQRVVTCLLELGIEYELISLDLHSGDQKKPDFLPRQPFGQVHAIEDGDFKLFGKSASEGGMNLLGNTLEERATVDQWLEVEAHNYNSYIYTVVLQLLVLPQMGREGNLELVRDCKDKLEKTLDVNEERLSKSKYLGGDTISLADLGHLPNTRFLMEEG